MADGIRVNGYAYSWGSIYLAIGERPFFQFSEVSFSDKRERAKFTGMGKSQAPSARSRGKYTTENPKLKGLKETCDDLRAALAEVNPLGGTGYGDTPFNVYIEFSEQEPSGAYKMTTVELIDCLYEGTTETHTEGPDVLVEEIEINCMRILRDGLPLYDDSAEGSA